jgi:hypothetical protein
MAENCDDETRVPTLDEEEGGETVEMLRKAGLAT